MLSQKLAKWKITPAILYKKNSLSKCNLQNQHFLLTNTKVGANVWNFNKSSHLTFNHSWASPYSTMTMVMTLLGQWGEG